MLALAFVPLYFLAWDWGLRLVFGEPLSTGANHEYFGWLVVSSFGLVGGYPIMILVWLAVSYVIDRRVSVARAGLVLVAWAALLAAWVWIFERHMQRIDCETELRLTDCRR